MTMNATQLGTLFAQLVPGFPVKLATEWVTIENGANGNVLGLTVANGSATRVYPGQTGTFQASNGQWLAAFPTPQAGILAAANHLLTSPYYSAVRAAVRSGDPNAVASALVASPWNTPGSAYYASHFTAVGYHIDLSTVPGATPSPSIDQPLSPATGTLAIDTTPPSGLTNLASLLGLPPTTPISAGTLGNIQKKVAALLSAGTISSTVAQNIYATLGGYAKTGGTEQLGGVSVDLSTGNEQPPTPAGVAGTLVQAVGTAAGPLIVAGAILASALVLGYLGVQRLLPAD